LIDVLWEADRNNAAVGHFNISNIEGLWAIFRAARSLNLPVVIGLSEGERDFFGEKQAVAIVRSIRDEYSVIFDGAKLPLEENIQKAKECVTYAKSKNPDVLVELELGYIGTSSKLLDAIPEGASITDDMMAHPEDAKRLMDESGADLLSPAVGNIHGMLKNAPNPELNIERIKAIKEATGKPLVLHGGSGISEQNFKDAIANGIDMVHINTEIRVAYRDALKQSNHEALG
jgi:fructose-bisphosphate aldolase class II